MTEISPQLAAALAPASVAVIGASENQHKIGGRPILYMSRFGYKGRIFPVNPGRATVQGLRAYGSIVDLPETPDMAIIAVPGDAAESAARDCAVRGVKVAVMMASGFREGGGPAGEARERELAAYCRARGMRMVGPNSQGLANFGNGAVASFSTMFLEMPPQDGPVAVLSQSGAMSAIPYGLLRGRGIGVRHAHSTGNDADVNVSELAAAVAQDRDVRLLLLYLEQIPFPHQLAALATAALERDLPILALKSGRTAEGKAAAQSHTGALASDDRVVDAFFERYGIWRVRDTDELVEASELYLKGWHPRGRRTVIVSNSGAVCVLGADAASKANMPLAQLSDSTRSRVGAMLPSFATTSNPIDITAALLTNSRLFSDILPIVAQDAAADALLVGIAVAGIGYDVPAFARDTAAFAEMTGKPTVAAASQASVAAQFRDAGVPVFVTESRAVAALNQFISHRFLMGRARRRRAAASLQREARPGGGTLLSEADGLDLVSQAGVPTVARRVVQSLDAGLVAAAELGYPVVLKANSHKVAHKSEFGLVHVNIPDAEALRVAWFAIMGELAHAGLQFEGTLVAAMARGHELLIGAHWDPIFGPVVAVGGGGKYVEALKDVELLIAPFGREEVLGKIASLRIAPVLAGQRGEGPAALEIYASAAIAVGDLIATDDRIESLDLNPFILGSYDGVAADAVVIGHFARR